MCSDSDPDTRLSRRRLLIHTVEALSIIGLAGASIPLLRACSPQGVAVKKNAPLKQDLSALDVGQMITLNWQGKPVFVIRRSDAMLKTLAPNANQLRDPLSVESKQPDYAKNIYRARDPHILVVVGVCTHLSCTPSYRPDQAGDLGPDWRGGFFCPCHGSRFDLAGRVFQGSPAPTNLTVPPYQLVGNILTLGEPNPGEHT